MADKHECYIPSNDLAITQEPAAAEIAGMGTELLRALG